MGQTHIDAYRIEVLKRSYDARMGQYRFGVLKTSKWSRARIFCKPTPKVTVPGRPKKPDLSIRG